MKTRIEAPSKALPIRSPWSAKFPDADIHAGESRVKKHPSYATAKAGDVEASVDLVEDVMSSTATERLRQYGGAVLLPVHGLEDVSANTIPMAMAVCFSDRLGLAVATNVIQTTRAGHTGASGWWRLESQALFSGDITPGRDHTRRTWDFGFAPKDFCRPHKLLLTTAN